jgi:hypothetical protein
MTWPVDTSTMVVKYCAPAAAMELKANRGINNQQLWLMLGSPEAKTDNRDTAQTHSKLSGQ